MRIIVKSKPAAREDKVELLAQEVGLPVYKVSVRKLPIRGQANKAIIKALAKHFGVAPSLITLVSGPSSKQKIFEILE